MVKSIKEDYRDMIMAAVQEVERLQGKITATPGGPVEIPDMEIPAEPKAGDLVLSREAVMIIAKTIREAAKAGSLKEALEINYQGSGEIACLDAAKEGITAFLEKRKPVYKK